VRSATAWKGVVWNRSRRCPTRCADPVWTKPRGQGGRPTATHHIMAIASALPSWPLTATAATAIVQWHALPLNVAIVDNDRGDSPSSYRARALGPGAQQVPPTTALLPPGHMQGGSRCPGRVVERERARRHDPVLGRWLGLTPERPALCLRGFPGRPKVALSRASDSPGLGRR
jgi:hypothetical protein